MKISADEMKKRLEEIDPCEKLRSLCKKGEVEVKIGTVNVNVI